MNNYDYSVYYSRFHDGSEAQSERAADDVVNILHGILPSDRAARVLDFGCGFGSAMRALRRLGFTNLMGLEISPQQADHAQKAGFNVELTDDSMAWLAARPGTFDCVILFDVIEHVPVANQIELLRAVYRCLRPGGRMILTTPNASAILFGRWRYNDYTHCSSFTEHSLYFILKNAGFETIRIDASKGLGRVSLRLWKRSTWCAIRKWIVRWFWLQIFKAEMPWENLNQISFDLNLKAVAIKL